MRTLSRLAAVGLAVGVGVSFAQPVPQPAPIIPASATDPLLRPEPAVALDWTGPAVVRVGKPNSYTLTVKNTSRGFVQQVTVQVRPPEGAAVSEPKPAARVVDGVYLWDVGTLEPGEAKPLTLTLTSGKRGDLACQAWVTLTGTAGMTVKVQEPKVAVEVRGPKTVPIGERVELEMVATNTGDCPLAELRLEVSSPNPVSVQLGDGKTAVATDTQTQRFPDVGTGESRRMKLLQRLDVPGDVSCVVTARGGDGVTATTTHTVRVIAPKLAAGVSGPDKLLVGRKGTYTLTVKNTGELAVEGAAVAVTLPPGLRGTSPDGRLTFPVGDLKPGEERTRTFDATAATAGLQPVTATATGSRGATATAECRTAVDGVPALRVELVDLADPVEKGQETTYEIRLTNTGTKSDEAVKLVCELPAGIKFASATGPTGHTHTLVTTVIGQGTTAQDTRLTFDPVRELAPKTEAVFRVKVKATAAGDVRFKATVTSRHLATPVMKEESTRVYGD